MLARLLTLQHIYISLSLLTSTFSYSISSPISSLPISLSLSSKPDSSKHNSWRIASLKGNPIISSMLTDWRCCCDWARWSKTLEASSPSWSHSWNAMYGVWHCQGLPEIWSAWKMYNEVAHRTYCRCVLMHVAIWTDYGPLPTRKLPQSATPWPHAFQTTDKISFHLAIEHTNCKSLLSQPFHREHQRSSWSSKKCPKPRNESLNCNICTSMKLRWIRATGHLLDRMLQLANVHWLQHLVALAWETERESCGVKWRGTHVAPVCERTFWRDTLPISSSNQTDLWNNSQWLHPNYKNRN